MDITDDQTRCNDNACLESVSCERFLQRNKKKWYSNVSTMFGDRQLPSDLCPYKIPIQKEEKRKKKNG